MNVKLIAIAALGKNREIGLNGKLPWHFPDEYQHFMKTVQGHHILIGRKNFEANNKNIPGTHPIVLTRDKDYSSPGAVVIHDIKELIQHAHEFAIPEIYVIGGAEIYKLCMPYLSEFIWSEVDYEGPADTYFPPFSDLPWKTLNEEVHEGWKMTHLKKL